MKKIITISREFGAGGGEMGKLIAKALNYEYYDKEIILKAARESNVDVERLLKWDEKVPLDFGFAQSLFDFYNRPLSDRLFEIQKQVIREIGEKGNCVIVGRNANMILKEFDYTLHLFVHADSHWRLERMKKKMPNQKEAKVSEQIHAIDRTRKKYCSHYTNTEFGVADYYDISFNTATIGIATCADIVCNLAKKK
ncbi:cytidylate kinase-like family protein [Petrocella sp. FN5]|uniref:cytidylate kinase-like family protein n=1 Tax=Petrocella sp. FN5 TaxID=3032002 RepID=UPI0023DB5BBE|nr:cytidylate kinase-like family protein [Petrocella sp. FN5]MDF1617929.1 cytidylate kinase-like family protein [Petrocella sp. FN5]